MIKGVIVPLVQKQFIHFTNFSDQEIADYFIARNDKEFCGRLMRAQVERIRIEIPENILTTRQPYWRKFLVVCLLVFGTSVFPFETTLSQTLIASVTTEPAKDNQKKKKIRKAKKKKSKETTYLLKGCLDMVMGYMGPKEGPIPSHLAWIKPYDSSKSIIEDSLTNKNDIPQKDKNSDQPSKKIHSLLFLPSPIKPGAPPRKNPDSVGFFHPLIYPPFYSIHSRSLLGPVNHRFFTSNCSS